MPIFSLDKSLSAIKSLVGTANDREIRKLQPMVEAINSLENKMVDFSDSQLCEQTQFLKDRVKKGEPLEDLLVESFAIVREAGKRVLQMRHFDVQLVGGIVLHRGKISEMKTGEGKTLVATLPAFLNALAGKGVHIVTVNDYLAKRDSEWMGQIFRFLGLTVGCIQHSMDDEERKEAYLCDITYGTNNEFGFDYLRDNMKFERGSRIQRELSFGIVDEVDSILIDEARTPLIISGPAEEATKLYLSVNRIIRKLLQEEDADIVPEINKDDYVEGGKDAISKKQYKYLIVDEKSRTANLKEIGGVEAEKILSSAGILDEGKSLYDMESISILHHVEQSLKAYVLFTKDIDYVVKDGQVIIVDEFTGRLTPGRRFGDGLHQALEAKEKVEVQEENVTLATITFQNYFRLYEKLSGMTGTADTEAKEFKEIYNLDVIVIPTNKTLIRTEYPDVIYKTDSEKMDAVVEELSECYKSGRPVLVGTINIDKSEQLSKILKKRGVPHHILNAKHHSHEAEIIAQAGRKSAITISTNMAGRGTDILLGGNPEFLLNNSNKKDDQGREALLQEYIQQCEAEREEVIALGGLHVLATERHESRRIDNQLRGRSGRQGDPGSSRFYLSLEDDLLRIFGSDRIKGLMEKLGMEEGVPIEAKMVTRSIEGAQKRVEAHHFEMRKNILEYDDVMNMQRDVIYSLRRSMLDGEEITDQIKEMVINVLEGILDVHFPESVHFEEWDLDAFKTNIESQFSITSKISGYQIEFEGLDRVLNIEEETVEELRAKIHSMVMDVLVKKYAHLGDELFQEWQMMVYLQILDSHWKEHLTNIDHLKEGIGLRGYAQVNPLNEYKKEAYHMFEELTEKIESDTVTYLYRLDVSDDGDIITKHDESENLVYTHQEVSGFDNASEESEAQVLSPVRRSDPKVGRNSPCPCGSGKKYKFCCGK
ncbi:MAG: preprotein translocase subunit SecA [Nitrospinota bacterium]|nr:preprotein translocase subunit SecA [Nitrospinota bacterium]